MGVLEKIGKVLEEEVETLLGVAEVLKVVMEVLDWVVDLYGEAVRGSGEHAWP